MNTPLLERRHYTPPPGLPFLDDLSLAYARVHEFCGHGRRRLALMVAARMEGQIFWIQSHWQKDRLHGAGVRKHINPARITFVTPKRLEDLLWAMEEVLRTGIIPLVVLEVPEPPPLTPIRRLNLAAEAGAKRKSAPLGLILTPGDGGAAGVESRWHMAPRHDADQYAWMLDRRRARMAPPAAWAVEWQPDYICEFGLPNNGPGKPKITKEL